MSSSFTLAYKIAWLPRLLLAGLGPQTGFPASPMGHHVSLPPGGKKILFLGDLSAVANRRPPQFCEGFRNLCRSADVIIANCESPIVSRSIMPLQTRLGFCHAMTERFFADVLAAAEIAPSRLVLSIANNHIADQARAGIAETVAVLRAMGGALVGLKTINASPWETVIIDGVRIACLAFTTWLDRDLPLMREMIHCDEPREEDVRAPPECDLACAIPHWGTEFRYRPDGETRKLAARLAALGADVVAGTHPHVVQPLEAMGRTLVAYSLGDFVGSVLARSPRHVRLSLALAVDFVPGAEAGSRIAGYQAHPYFRMALGDHERVEAIDALPGRESRRAQRLIARILGAPLPGPIAKPDVVGAAAPAS